MAKIPLNKFRSLGYNITTTLSAIYTAPDERASILVSAQVANTTSEDISVTCMLSSGRNTFAVVSAFPIPPNDARSLTTGRFVLQGFDGGSIVRPDVFLVSADKAGAVLTLGILETVNRD